MLYSDILTRETIKAGKHIIDEFIAEGWEVHCAAWLLHGSASEDDEWYPGYEIIKEWKLHVLVPQDNRDALSCARRRISALRDACIDRMYGDALPEDYFRILVEPLDSFLAEWFTSLPAYPMEHPLGHRLPATNSNHIRDGFVYNLKQTAAGKVEREWNTKP